MGTQKSDDWGLEEIPLSVVESLDDNSRANRGKIMKALRELDKQRKIAEAKAALLQAIEGSE